MYAERKSEKGGEWVFHSIGGTTKVGAMHLRPVSTPYPTKEWLQPKRYKAHLMGTQYVYDFPELFRQAIQNSWTKAVEKTPSLADKQPPVGECIDYSELVLDDQTTLPRSPASPVPTPTVWLVGSSLHAPLSTPAAGSSSSLPTTSPSRLVRFGPKEDQFFHKCTELARKMGIPRIYLSANSGARIGMAEELIPHFNVAWNNPEKPEAGFKYLYLTPEAKKRFEDGKTQGCHH